MIVGRKAEIDLKDLEDRQVAAFKKSLQGGAPDNELLIMLQESVRATRQLQDLLKKNG